MSPRPAPIRDRFRRAMSGRTEAPYREILMLVFPPEHYPDAHRYAREGGPPACAMAFKAALRRLGGRRLGNRVVFDAPIQDPAALPLDAW